jgi:hypothetical protein
LTLPRVEPPTVTRVAKNIARPSVTIGTTIAMRMLLVMAWRKVASVNSFA